MSASDKKRARKELNAAALTEKQLQAQKEAKKLKAYTLTFVIAMVLVVAIVLGVIVTPYVVGAINRNTHAVNVGNRELTTTDLTYYYVDAITSYYSNFSSQYGDYADLYAQMMGGVVSTLPLDEQIYDQETGKTWADYFIEEAKTSAIWTYAIYDEAMAKGFKVSEDTQEYLDDFEDMLTPYAQLYGYSSLSSYLRSYYGEGASVKTYKEYYTYNAIATEYANEYLNSIEFKDEDYRAHEKDKYHEYNSYSYSVYYVRSSDYLTFLELGTEEKGEDGKTSTTYSDEDRATALAAAKKDAETLSAAANNDVTKLNQALAALDINKDKKDENKPTFTENDAILYSSLSGNEDIQKWLSDSARKAGDVTMIEYKTKGSDDKETVNGYYVVLFEEVNENKMMLANVRHILVKFTGGTKNETTGETTYSDKEKEDTKKKAQEILDLFNTTKKQDEDFAKLAKERSEDTGSKTDGGLIEDIYPDAGYVESFTEWALAGHKPGDTGIIESPYGYHVMYYKEDGELSYRDFLIDNELTTDAYTAWQDGLTEKVTATDVNLSGIERDYIIAG